MGFCSRCHEKGYYLVRERDAANQLIKEILIDCMVYDGTPEFDAITERIKAYIMRIKKS